MEKMPEDLKKLEEKIVQFEQSHSPKNKIVNEAPLVRFSKVGLRIGAEMLSGVLVGGAIGYLLDKLLQTRPWLLVVFLFLGGAAGVLNVYRFAKSEENQKE